MMNMIVFAVTFVVAQTVAGLILVKLFMSKGFLKKYSKLIVEIGEEIAEEMND